MGLGVEGNYPPAAPRPCTKKFCCKGEREICLPPPRTGTFPSQHSPSQCKEIVCDVSVVCVVCVRVCMCVRACMFLHETKDADYHCGDEGTLPPMDKSPIVRTSAATTGSRQKSNSVEGTLAIVLKYFIFVLAGLFCCLSCMKCVCSP